MSDRRGKTRSQPGYLVARGWFYRPIQKIVREWDEVFEREFIVQTFIELRRTMENGCGNLNIEIQNPQHRRLVCELMTAMDQLHDNDSIEGWIVKIWPTWSKTAHRRLLRYLDVAEEIKARGGPTFSRDALKAAARRLRMMEPEAAIQTLEASCWNAETHLIPIDDSVGYINTSGENIIKKKQPPRNISSSETR